MIKYVLLLATIFCACSFATTKPDLICKFENAKGQYTSSKSFKVKTKNIITKGEIIIIDPKDAMSYGRTAELDDAGKLLLINSDELTSYNGKYQKHFYDKSNDILKANKILMTDKEILMKTSKSSGGFISQNGKKVDKNSFQYDKKTKKFTLSLKYSSRGMYFISFWWDTQKVKLEGQCL